MFNHFAHNKELHENGEKFMAATSLNYGLTMNIFLAIQNVPGSAAAYSKSVTQAVNDGQNAFKKIL